MKETITFLQETYVERNYIVNTPLGAFYVEHQNIMSVILVTCIYLFLFYFFWQLTRGFK